jgi:hypothetical protein
MRVVAVLSGIFLVAGVSMVVMCGMRMNDFLTSVVPGFFVGVYETHNHNMFVRRMLGICENTTSLNMGLTLREVAVKTHVSISVVNKHLALITAVKLTDEENELIEKTRIVLERLEIVAYDVHHTAIESRSFFFTFSHSLRNMADAYEEGDYGAVVACLSEMETKIDEVQKRFAIIQTSVHRVYVEAGEVERLSSNAAMRISKEGARAEGSWPLEKVGALTAAGCAMGLALSWTPFVGVIAGGTMASLFGMTQRASNAQLSKEMQEDAEQLMLFASECQTVIFGLRKFNATLDSLRTAIRDSKPLVRKLKRNVFSDIGSKFRAALEQVFLHSMLIVAQHDKLLDEWYDELPSSPPGQQLDSGS